MSFNTEILPILIAGLMNGSFVIPTKYIKNFTNEKIWFLHSIVGIAIIPWILLILTVPQAIHYYAFLQLNIILFIILSGIIFGIGQLFFAYAIEHIGLALSFAINLSIGVTLGSIYVLFYENSLFTHRGSLVSLAVLLIVTGLVSSYLAGNSASRQISSYFSSRYRLGWAFATITGIASGLQNITFITVLFNTAKQSSDTNSFWIWPPFLLAASLPMLLGFYYKMPKSTFKNRTRVNGFLYLKNLLLITLMGLFFSGSLSLYSIGISELTHQEQIIAWPVFMVSIILISQIWDWFYNPSKLLHRNSFIYKLISILLLIVAIVLLAIAK